MKVPSYFILILLFSYCNLFAQIDTVGILYLDESNTENIDFKLKEILKSRIGDRYQILTEGYTKGTLLSKYNNLVKAGTDIIIGPSGSQALLTINNYVRDSHINRKPYFIGPTVSADASIFSHVDFINTSATNNQKVNLLYKNLIAQYDIDEIGLMYESDAWGLSIVKEFDEVKEIQVTSRPFPKFNRLQDRYHPIARFIEILYSKDIRLVVIASWDDKILSKFLEELSFFNGTLNISSYRPIVVLYNNYDLEKINKSHITNYDLYSITELSDKYINLEITDEVANTIDATELISAILKETNDVNSFIKSYESFHKQTGYNIDLKGTVFYTKNYNRLRDQSNVNSLNLMSVYLESDSIKKSVFDSFGSNQLIKFFETRVFPLFSFHVFPKNPYVLVAFLVMTFVSFILFMHNEYYTPFSLLLKSKSFWTWYLIYAIVTTISITTLLYSGIIRSNQLQVIIVAGIVCPLVLNYIFKQLTNFRLPIPILTNSIISFLNNLKHSIDVVFHKTFGYFGVMVPLISE